MGKESSKSKGGRSQRHDPLHVQLADIPESTTMKKAPRQKFVDRANRAEETGGEVRKFVNLDRHDQTNSLFMNLI
jgi:essential nuclear protein 1